MATQPEGRAAHPSRAWRSCVPPDDYKPPPFICGALTSQNRRLVSVAFQLTTGHCFDAAYSINFREGADDNNTCPCSPSPNPFHHRFALHTYQHILLHCPLCSQQRLTILGPTPSIQYIFSTEDGGRKLCEYLHATQALLRPLPPRPDPP